MNFERQLRALKDSPSDLRKMMFPLTVDILKASRFMTEPGMERPRIGRRRDKPATAPETLNSNIEPRPETGVNLIMVKRGKEFVRVGIATVMIAVSGCSWMQHPGRGAQSQQMADADVPPPFVQDCAIVSISSPSKFACNGKTYTTFDLLKLRLAWEKSHGG
jgi:hypothetical protein